MAAAAIAALAMALLLLPRCSPESEPAYGDTPILRLDPQQHSGTIFRAGIDAKGRLMVTAGSDDVVKIWRVDDPKQIRVVNTLRVPISKEAAVDPSAAGLRAVDISPDGMLIAAAGQTRADGTFRLLVLAAATGEILHDLLSARGIITDLAFSPDGQSLAVGLYACDSAPVETCPDANNGLWVWNTAKWNAAPYRDKAYQGRINGIAFNRAGDLFTTSFDRRLRRYGAEQRKHSDFAPTPAPARPFARDYDRDIRPYDLAVAPDGQTILVGYLNEQDRDDPAALTQYSASDLEPVRDYDIGGLPADHGGPVQATVVNGVSFSRDGAYVYASIAQHQSHDADKVLRRWSAADANARPKDFGLCTSQTIIQVLPYQGHGAIFASSDPCVSAIDDAGARFDVPRSVYPIDNHNLGPTDPGLLLVSESGDRFYLAHEVAGRGVAFDLMERRLTVNPAAADPSRKGVTDGYRETSGGTTMSKWCCSGTAPAINRVPIALGGTSGGVTWSTDVAPNGDFAVLGTSTFLARYDRSGRRLWQYRTPDVPRRVNIAPNARTATVLYRDGVLRWHNIEDGSVLLSLFIDASGENWVMWTQAGYYDSSTGGDAILGWHLNNGGDVAPSWLPVTRYANAFRRPDVINHVIKYIRDGLATPGLAAANSTALANEMIRRNAPPIVQIADARMRSDGTQMLLTYIVNSPSGDPVTGVHIDINGRPAAVEPPQARAGERIQWTLPIDIASDEYVGIRAINRNGIGEVSTVRVLDAYRNASLNPPPLVPSAIPESTKPLPPVADRPVLHALVIGSNYAYRNRGRLAQLCCASEDARAFAQFLRRQNTHDERALYSDVKVIELKDEEATLNALQANLSQLSRVNGNSVILIFLAGHGVSDSRGRYHYIPYGVDPDSGRLEHVALTGARITRALQEARVPAMLFMDTCNSQGALERSFLSEVYNLQRNIFTFSSSRDGQASLERRAWGHGAFTYALLQVLHGEPIADNDGIVTFSELGPNLRELVTQMTSKQQVPQYFGWGPQGANPQSNLFTVRR
ncbi:caspase family protein [Sphingomonas gei]|nr:caspase family protein [Sphingomonas gei]